MSLWLWIVAACAVAYLTKLAGYVLPNHVLDHPLVPGVAAALTVGLLASLTTSNALGAGQGLSLDARLLAVAVAGVALWFRAPFLVVVVLGAAAAAVGRLVGLP